MDEDEDEGAVQKKIFSFLRPERQADRQTDRKTKRLFSLVINTKVVQNVNRMSER